MKHIPQHLIYTGNTKSMTLKSWGCSMTQTVLCNPKHLFPLFHHWSGVPFNIRRWSLHSNCSCHLLSPYICSITVLSTSCRLSSRHNKLWVNSIFHIWRNWSTNRFNKTCSKLVREYVALKFKWSNSRTGALNTKVLYPAWRCQLLCLEKGDEKWEQILEYLLCARHYMRCYPFYVH